MTINEKNEKCKAFFETLVNILGDRYERISSCNNDASEYLCPVGTSEEISYYGKPEESFRISNHWNWYANTNKCSDPRRIQCFCVDLPWAHHRMKAGKAGKPIMANCVCVYRNRKYHVIYGECFDRKTKTWSWIDNSPEMALSELKIEL